MGTVLKEKFNFTVLNSIRDAYSMAFHNHGEKIQAAISDQSLDALNAARNLIVHKAGVIDRRYYNETKNLTLAPKGQIGERISLDGQIVATLVNTGLERCNGLILAVDEWLLRHPQ
jgi:hypothetical protein